MDLDASFEEMRGAEQLPTTSHPTTDDFRECYEKLLDNSDAIVSVHSSGQLSRTIAAAAEAATQLGADERITVIDSQSAGGGLALIALAAARRAQAGESAERVVATAEEAIFREKQIKAWTRAKRIALIESLNPAWDDLFHSLN